MNTKHANHASHAQHATDHTVTFADHAGRHYRGCHNPRTHLWTLLLPDGQTATGVRQSSIDERLYCYEGWIVLT